MGKLEEGMTDQEKAVKEAQESLGVKFADEYLLQVALTHSSFAYEVGAADFNEKLEFLGDSVLGIVITEYIFHAFPKFQEGGLAKLRANLVRAETLAEVARDLRVGSFVLIGRGAEQSGGRDNESILADCMEAIIGAIYIDQGLEVTKKFLIELFRTRIEKQGQAKELGDPKTTLQELTMERWSMLPTYKIVAQDGPAHRPMFSAAVAVKGHVYGRGVGTSKKRAQQIAAKEALKEISKLEY